MLPLLRIFAAGIFVLLASLAAQAGAVELVYVFDPGCPYCRLWDKEIAPVYEKTAEGQRAPIKKIDKQDPVLDSMNMERPVHYTPTFVLMQDEREIGRIEGYPGEDFFWVRLASLLEKLSAAEKPATGNNTP